MYVRTYSEPTHTYIGEDDANWEKEDFDVWSIADVIGRVHAPHIVQQAH